MRLEKINVEKISDLGIATFQRDTTPEKVKDLYNFFIERGFFDCLPLLVDGNYNIVDGGHRAEAYLRAFKDGKVKNELYILINESADINTFLNVNKGTPVSINHKVKIHKITNILKASGIVLSTKTTSISLSYVDLARALAIVYRTKNKLSLKQSSQKELFTYIDYFCNQDELLDIVSEIIEIKNIYFESISKDSSKKYLQKLFLYLISFSFKNKKINASLMDKIVNRFPLSLGGDISVAYNKQLFVDAYNYNLKLESNRITLLDV